MERSGSRGFTLVEVTTILVALGILSAVLVPSIGGFNSLARTVRMREDIGVLCSTLKMMLDDLGATSVWTSQRTSTRTGFASYGGSTGTRSSGVTMTESHGVDQWCDDCGMGRMHCGDDCRDDCGRECNMTPVTTTTQTYGFESSGAARQSAGGYASSYSRSSSAIYGYGRPVGLLAGQGRIPGSSIGATPWQLDVGTSFQQSTTWNYAVPVSFEVETFDDQMIVRDPTIDGAYGGPISQGGVLAPFSGGSFRWRGPYIADAVVADPWGNRYMANVFALHKPTVNQSQSGRAAAAARSLGINATRYDITRGRLPEFTSAVVCYSAGPNGVIDTPFNQPYGWSTGGDDVTAVLAGAGGI